MWQHLIFLFCFIVWSDYATGNVPVPILHGDCANRRPRSQGGVDSHPSFFTGPQKGAKTHIARYWLLQQSFNRLDKSVKV